MNIVQRADEIEARARARTAEALVTKDLAWWARRMRRAAKRGLNTCSTEGRLFWNHRKRATEEYLAALARELGSDITTAHKPAWTSDGNQIIQYKAVVLSWT